MIGEFEKEIECWKLASPELKCTERNLKRIAREMIENARKEFPECYEISSTRIYDVHEIKEWFEKWFGDE